MKDMKFLLLEGIHQAARDQFCHMGFQVQACTSAHWQSTAQKLAPTGLCVRSRTKITKEILQSLTPSLRVIGAFCIGTDQIDLPSARQLGVPVFNAPYGNTRSVAELTLGHIIALCRRTYWFNNMMHQKKWHKTAQRAYEVRGKKLGIIGYGHIGTQVGILAESLGLKVCYFDIIEKLPIGNACAVSSLKELLSLSDIVTIHVPDTQFTKNMIAQNQLKWMKPNSMLINTSRGSVVNTKDVKQALKKGHLKGVAVDVFQDEPSVNDADFLHELQGVDNVILTPHIAGSTMEAQENIARQVSTVLTRYLLHGDTTGAVNFPILSPPPLDDLDKYQRLTNVHHNVPGVLASINGLVSDLKINIKAQHLATNATIGYLVMDVQKTQIQTLLSAVNALKTSISTFLLPVS